MSTPPTHWRFKNLVGQTFGRLTVTAYAGREHGSRMSRWSCRCKCGNTVVVVGGSLTRGASRSCGCLQRELVGARGRTHDGRKRPEYKVWLGMRRRCCNPKETQYADYGGRGIRVCKRWVNSFAAFFEDMGPRPTPGHTIDRKNNDGPYSPANCRWATRAEQRRNCRPHHLRLLNVGGKTLCLTDAAEVLGMTREQLRRKLDAGVSPQELRPTRTPR